MSRSKSALRSASGIAHQVFNAFADAILRAGGNDDEIRLMEQPDIANACAALVMARAGIPKPAQIIDGLTVYEIEVDGDDPRWSKIEPSKYAYCNNTARTGDFPNRPGKRIVRYVLLPFAFDPTNQQIIDDTARRNLTRPDRAITETILDARKAECVDKPIVGVSGVVQSDTNGHSVVGCVREDADGRDLVLDALRNYWGQDCQFVAVVSE